jgi:RNA-directed DNA polymerase
VSQPSLKEKPFAISKQAVWEAFRKVKANQGAPGVDGQTIEEFEADLRNNLYRVWNRMSSGSYFPPPVRAVDIAKPHGGGMRRLGVPTVADRIAQTVVAMKLEKVVEPKFHPSSYGYRPGRSPLEAVEACRRRCFTHPWVVDLDIEKFFDAVPWDLIVKAVEANTDQKWVRLYIQRRVNYNRSRSGKRGAAHSTRTRIYGRTRRTRLGPPWTPFSALLRTLRGPRRPGERVRAGRPGSWPSRSHLRTFAVVAAQLPACS